MYLKTALRVMVRTHALVTLLDVFASEAFLRRGARINIGNSFTESFSFELREPGKLEKVAVVKFSGKNFYPSS